MRQLLCAGLLGLALGLTACGGERTISGEVVDRETGADGAVVLTIQQEDGESVGLRIGSDTLTYTMLDEVDGAALRTGDYTGLLVSAVQGSRAEDGPDGLTVYETPRASVVGLLIPDARTLSDGTSLTERRMEFPFGIYYQLEDGTELLNDRTYYPLGQMIGDEAEMDGLSPQAAQNIRDFYDQRGPLYDTDALLEAAYEAYQAREGEPFDNGYSVEQQVWQNAANDELWFASTTVYLPLGDGCGTEVRLGEIFDRATGEPVSLWDLFTCSSEEAPAQLVTAMALDDLALEAELLAALRPEYVTCYEELLEVHYPLGTVPSMDTSFGVAVDYERLEGLLHPWAVPDPPPAPSDA